MTNTRKPKRQSKVSRKTETYLARGSEGEARLNEFLQRLQNGKNSRRGNHYDTQPDHTWHSARTYHDRMEDRV